jgi:asparagine synthase (glutamine-hydrolysing)
MANFVAVVDPDAVRRAEFVGRVRRRIAFLEGLTPGETGFGDFSCAWASGRPEVASVARAEAGAAVVWGDAVRAEGGRANAAAVLAEWNVEVPPAYDAFFAAVRYDAKRGLTAGADVLGYFPIYYASARDVVVVASSPELFGEHPLFPPQLSLEGLAGVLMVHAPVSGRSLLEGVRRLSWGQALRWTRESGAREVTQYALPAPADESESFESAYERLDDAFASAVRRHVPAGETHGILLSGGRDSRLVAGYANESGGDLRALSFGNHDDYDASCARAVSRSLGYPHRIVSLDDGALARHAETQARWEHLCGGFASIHMWGAVPRARELPARVLTGYGLETRAGEPLPFDFEGMMNLRKHRGVARPAMRRLFRDPSVVDSVESELRTTHAGYSDRGEHRWWRFYLDHDWRSHAGGVPWKLSFGAWPIVPLCDRGVMDAIATIPAGVIANRGVHDAILRRRFPRLARLPLDRNNHDTTPLSPSPLATMRERIVQPRRIRMSKTVERRYYHRVYDIESRGWRDVRSLAEPLRENLSEFLSIDELRSLVPPPDARIEVENKVRDTFGMKLLVGLMLWSDRLSC